MGTWPSPRAMEKIEREGFRADTRTYDALVRVGRGGVEATGLLRRLEEEGVELARAYDGRGRALDRESCEVVAGELIMLRKVEEAKRVVEEMVEKGLFIGFGLKIEGLIGRRVCGLVSIHEEVEKIVEFVEMTERRMEQLGQALAEFVDLHQFPSEGEREKEAAARVVELPEMRQRREEGLMPLQMHIRGCSTGS